MAMQLSSALNGPSPLRSSRDGDGDDAPDSQLGHDDNDQVAKRGKTDGKKKKKQLALAETASPDSTLTFAHSATAIGKKRKTHDAVKVVLDHVGNDDDEVDYDADFEMAMQLSSALNGPSPLRSSRDGDGDDAPGSQLGPDALLDHGGNDDDEVDYDADFEMAMQLSSALNGPSPLRSSRDGDGDDAPGSQLGPDDSDQVAKRGKKDGKKKRKQLALAETASPDSTMAMQLSSALNGPIPLRSSRDGDGDDAPGFQLGPDDSDQVAKRGKKDGKKKRKQLALAETASPDPTLTSAQEESVPYLQFKFPSPFVPVNSAQAATTSPQFEGDDDISSDGDPVFANESRLEAEEDNRFSVELSSMSAVDIWDTLFSVKKLKGGYMARSLFLAGKEVDSKICDPWIGGKTLCSKKQELSDQRKLFLQWAGDIRVLRWVRNTIFSIILAKPQTYKLLDVHHAEFPSKQGDDSAKDGLRLNVLEATDDTMARIAHLACEPDCRTALHMIHDTKHREHVENKDLQITALWQDLADQFVNNVEWETKDLQVAQLEFMKILPDGSQQRAKRVDASVAPYPGVSGDFVRATFKSLKGLFKSIADAVFGRTGCNTTGEDLYGQVWQNYIKGKLMYFPRPEVAMYLFKLWNECQSLPKYCIKKLKTGAACKVGVTSTCYTFPVTPRAPMTPSSSSTTGTVSTMRSPNLSGSASAATTASIDKLAECLVLEREMRLEFDHKRRLEDELKPKVLFACLF
jgi:hypothetical protein